MGRRCAQHPSDDRRRETATGRWSAGRRSSPAPGSAPKGGATTPQNLPLPPARGFAPPGGCLASTSGASRRSILLSREGKGEGNRDRARPAPTKQRGGGALAFRE